MDSQRARKQPGSFIFRGTFQSTVESQCSGPISAGVWRRTATCGGDGHRAAATGLRLLAALRRRQQKMKVRWHAWLGQQLGKD